MGGPSSVGAEPRVRVEPGEAFSETTRELVRSGTVLRGLLPKAVALGTERRRSDDLRLVGEWLERWRPQWAPSRGKSVVELPVDVVVELVQWLDVVGKGGRAAATVQAINARRADADLGKLESPLLDKVLGVVAKLHAQERQILIRDGFPVEEYVKLCSMEAPRSVVQFRRWVRDLLVVGMGIRLIRRPSELSWMNLDEVRVVAPPDAGWRLPPSAMGWVPRLWLEFTVRHSKTDQRDAGHVVMYEPTGSPACLLVRLLVYLTVYGLTLLPRTGKRDGAPRLLRNCRPALVSEGMSVGGVSSCFVRCAAILGLEEKGLHITGHSGRIGGATSCAARGVALEHIMAIGGWVSGAVMRYVRAVASAKLGVSSMLGL